MAHRRRIKTMKRKVFAALAGAIQARANCLQSGNTSWYDEHGRRADKIAADYLPSGSGIDCGTKIVWEKSTADRLVFQADYHHMTDGGMYDGWTEHTVIVTASLAFGIDIRVTGRNRNGIKEGNYPLTSSNLPAIL
jgi:hypothetical protein